MYYHYRPDPNDPSERSRAHILGMTWALGIAWLLSVWLILDMMTGGGPLWEFPEERPLYACIRCDSLLSPFDPDGRCDQCGFPHK